MVLTKIENRLREMYNTLKLTKKPDREEYNIHLRMLLLGLGVVGALAFIIQLISTYITLTFGG